MGSFLRHPARQKSRLGRARARIALLKGAIEYEKPFGFVTAFVAIVAAAGIAACATAGTSSAPPAAGSASTPFGRLLSPEGQKKVGPYVWVWRTATVGHSYMTIEADCPANYAVIGGGYHLQGGSVNATKPNDALTGWVVVASSAGTSHDTAYASCAPLK